MPDHDHSYKLLFSHPELVADLLRGFVHEEWVTRLDFSTLERVSSSFVSDDLRGREDDLIWRLRFGDRWLYVYLLLEFQSTVDRFMAVRLMTYCGLLYQDLIRTDQLTPAGLLPPVLPLVLYNGSRPWTAAPDVSDLVADVPGGLDRYRPRLRYLLLDENRFGNADLSGRNLAAAVFRLEHSRELADIVRVVKALKDWLQAPEQASLQRAFTVWLNRVLLPRGLPGQSVPEVNDLQEVSSMLEERVEEWTRTWREKGMEEGRKEGRKEGERLLLLRQLGHRFGPLPEALQQRIEVADDEMLLTWGERVLTASTLDDIFVP